MRALVLSWSGRALELCTVSVADLGGTRNTLMRVRPSAAECECVLGRTLLRGCGALNYEVYAP